MAESHLYTLGLSISTPDTVLKSHSAKMSRIQVDMCSMKQHVFIIVKKEMIGIDKEWISKLRYLMLKERT